MSVARRRQPSQVAVPRSSTAQAHSPSRTVRPQWQNLSWVERGLRQMADQDEWFRAFVERSLQEVWEEPQVVPDDDGDYAFAGLGPMAYVSIEPAPERGVCVWGYAAHGVKVSARVLREVNDLNMGARLCKVVWCEGVVRVELRLPADQVSVESLERACGHVQRCTTDIGPVLAAVHGGESVLARPRAS